METSLFSAAKGELTYCDDMIHAVVSHVDGDLEQSELLRESALLNNVITDCEITLQAKVSEYHLVYPQCSCGYCLSSSYVSNK